ACYRLTAHFGMDDQIDTHISAQIPGTNHFLMNPYGHLFREITASSLVKIDQNGEALDSSAPPVNRAGFVIHCAVHLARPDISCVFHTHTISGVAVSCLQSGLLPLTQFSLRFYERLAYHDYDGIALDRSEGQALVRD